MTRPLVQGRGIVGKPRRGWGLVQMCWYCGSGTWTGKLVAQPDGTQLHANCVEPAARDYPNRSACDGEQVDGKVAWLDRRDREDDAGAWRA